MHITMRRPISANKLFTYRDGIFEAMAHRFYNDSTFVAYGEIETGRAFFLHRGLTESLPYHRLFILLFQRNSACRYCLQVCIKWRRNWECVLRLYGKSRRRNFNHSKWQAMSAGILNMPLVLRISVGNKYGAQHSQDWSAMVAHIPGLKIFILPLMMLKGC